MNNKQTITEKNILVIMDGILNKITHNMKCDMDEIRKQLNKIKNIYSINMNDFDKLYDKLNNNETIDNDELEYYLNIIQDARNKNLIEKNHRTKEHHILLTPDEHIIANYMYDNMRDK